MKTGKLAAIVILGILLVAASACCPEGAGPEPTPTPTPSPTKTLTPCEIDENAIQAALDAYHAGHGQWPTIDGQPGDIVWDKLVPDFLDDIPSTDSLCDWQVNSDPEGEVCLQHEC